MERFKSLLNYISRVMTYMSAKNVVIQALLERVVSDELAVGLRPRDALAAGCVHGDHSVLGNVEVGRGLCAGLTEDSIMYRTFFSHCQLFVQKLKEYGRGHRLREACQDAESRNLGEMLFCTWASIIVGAVIRMTTAMEGTATAPIARAAILGLGRRVR